MKEMIRDLYETIQETEWIREKRAEEENAVEELMNLLILKEGKDREQVRDDLYGILMLAGGNGFETGFCYAVNLLMECALHEIKHRCTRGTNEIK